MQIKSYQDLDVWKMSKGLARDVYLLTANFPADERFGLTQQVRRAVVSVMSNIAEGSGRRSSQEFCRFVNIAFGSLCEVESQLLLAIDLKYIDALAVEKILQTADRISKMLYSLHRSLQSSLKPSTEYA